MKKIAFFLDNSRISSVDLSAIKTGNPGVGGTEFLITLIATLLSENNNNLDIALLSTRPGKFPSLLQNYVVDNFDGAYRLVNDRRYDYFVYKHMPEYVDTCLALLESSKVYTKIVPWCHNFCTPPYLRFYSQCTFVKRVICVGKEQLESYVDHQAYQKSDYIYNCLDVSLGAMNCNLHSSSREHNVVYIGSLIPEKGFHLLAKAWSKVIKKIPDAQLYVLGSAKLYSRKKKLGKFGIAEQSYENVLMRYLSENSKIMSSVHFLGIVGAEKYDILRQMKIGVPNPSGRTETFGLTAVEMQLCGVRVVTKKCPGYIDTVINGVLFNDNKELANLLIKELESKDEHDCKDALKQIESMFSFNNVIADWETLFNSKDDEFQKLHKECIKNNFAQKRIKLFLKRLKDKYSVFYKILPSVEGVKYVPSVIKGCIKSILS